MTQASRIAILGCKGGSRLARDVFSKLETICAEAGTITPVYIDSNETMFASGDIKTGLPQSLRHSDVYIFQDPYTTAIERPSHRYNLRTGKTKVSQVPLSMNDHLMALISAADAVHSADPENTINIVVPSFPGARQDKLESVYRAGENGDRERESLNAKFIARMLDQYGPGRVFTLDVHNDAITGFFDNKTLEVLYGSTALLPYVQSEVPLEDALIITPDTGRNDMAGYYAGKLGLDRIMMDKRRNRKGKVKGHTLLTPEGFDPSRYKTAIIVDDMVDTGGTIDGVLRSLNDKGFERTYVVSPLPLLNAGAKERFTKAHLDGVLTGLITTDAITHDEEFVDSSPWFIQLSVADYLARAIYNNHHGISVSRLASGNRGD